MVCDAFNLVSNNMREGQPLPYDLTGRQKQFQHKCALKKHRNFPMLFAICVHIYMCAYVQKTHTWWRKLPLVEYFFRKTNLACQRDYTTVVKYQIAKETAENLVLIGCQNNY